MDLRLAIKEPFQWTEIVLLSEAVNRITAILKAEKMFRHFIRQFLPKPILPVEESVGDCGFRVCTRSSYGKADRVVL